MREHELITRVLVDDDRHAFAELVKLHQSAVRAFLRRLCAGDRARADDLAQETFLKAYRSLSSWRREGALSSWLFGIAWRAFLSEARRTRKSRAHASAAVVEGSHAARDTHVLLTFDVERALHALRPEERAAIDLCFHQGLTHEEAARAVGWPLGTLKTHVARGKAKLKAALSSWRDAPALPGDEGAFP